MAFLFFMFILVLVFMVVVLFFSVNNRTVWNIKITKVGLFENRADVNASQIVLERKVVSITIIN